MAILRVKAGPQKGKLYNISSGENLVIGRESTGEIQILDQGVSRRHSEIVRIGEMYFIRDLESRNGTFVNDKKITEEILRIGDSIGIGNTMLVFEDRMSQLKDPGRLMGPEPGPVPSPSSTIQLKVTSELAARLGTATQETIEERDLEVLLHLSHIIAEEQDLSRLFSRVSELVGKSLSADHLYVLGVAAEPTSDGSGSRFEILGRYDRTENPGVSAGVSRGIMNDCLKHGRSVLTSDASLDQQFNAMESVVMKQLRSVLCVPMSVLGKSIGVVYVYTNKADAFKAEDLELASAVGIHLGSTIELLKLLRRSDQFFRSSIKTLVAAIEMRSPDDKGKSERVATYCLAVAKELGLSTQDLRDAWLAGMLHDIGSIPMTESERQNPLTNETKRSHVARELLRGTSGLEQVLPAIEQQNERFDGTGSPEGLRKEDFHPLARILALSLELDKILYHGGPDDTELSVKDTLLRIRDTADKQFDRQTVNALLIAYRNGKLFNRDQEFFEVPVG